MRINHNIAALNTYRQLTINNTVQQKSLQKLSSGFRINSAADDAAGLAISEKMRGQIRGLEMASKNAQDGISLIQTAEGALNETHSILQRMRELAVQAASDTNTADDRAEIQKEIDQLISEIDRIGNNTEFNTKKLLNGSATISATVSDTDAGDADLITILGGTGDTKVGSSITIDTNTLATADTATSVNAGLTESTAFAAASTITINGVSFSFTTSETYGDAIETINNAGLGATASIDASGNFVIESDVVGSASELSISGLGGDFAAAGAIDLSGGVTEGADATVTLTSGEAYSSKGNIITIESGDAKGLQFELSGTLDPTADTTVTVNENGGLFMHIGANKDQNMYISFSDMRAEALGVSGIDVTSKTNANSAITTINDAIQEVSAERAKMGAFQNRLEHTINNLGTSAENLTAAESRIRDVDMAKEMMEFTKTSILSQAAQAMLAQANQLPQGVLQLLR